jgi:hypothetical protein
MKMKRNASAISICGDDCGCKDCIEDEDAAAEFVKKRREKRSEVLALDVFHNGPPESSIRNTIFIVNEDDGDNHTNSYILLFTPSVLTTYYNKVFNAVKNGGIVHGFAEHPTIGAKAAMRLLDHLRSKYEVSECGMVTVNACSGGVYSIRVRM